MATIVTARIFDETQSKYKCCCGCMSVRTGAAVIATLKMFGVLMAVLELFTGPHFFSNIPQQQQQQNGEQAAISFMMKSTTTTTIDPFAEDGDSSFSSNINNNIGDDDTSSAVLAQPSIMSDGRDEENNGFGAVRFASTAIYLLVEAVAVSCLFYALRRERPKFVIPEMTLILICMSLELIVALLIVIAASFGSESLVQVVVGRLRAQGTEVTDGDVDQIRRLIPFVLTAFAFALVIGAAVEFWFFRTLKAFYVYLRDKATFRAFTGGDMSDFHQHCFVNAYQPMMEESATGTDTLLQQQQQKDLPPAYQDAVKIQQQLQHQADPTVQPPSYKEFAESAAANPEK